MAPNAFASNQSATDLAEGLGTRSCTNDLLLAVAPLCRREVSWHLQKIDEGGGREGLLLVFPVVKLPDWLPEARACGPTAKGVLHVAGDGSVRMGQFTDTEGLCGAGRWSEVASRLLPLQSPLATALDRNGLWPVKAFETDRSYKHFAAQSGYRDPWPPLLAVVERMFATLLRTTAIEVKCKAWPMPVISYVSTAPNNRLRAWRVQALDLMPHASVRLSVAQSAEDGYAHLRRAIDAGGQLFEPLGVALGCRPALARSLLQQARQGTLAPMSEPAFRAAMRLADQLGPNRWPQTSDEWSALVAEWVTVANSMSPSTFSTELADGLITTTRSRVRDRHRRLQLLTIRARLISAVNRIAKPLDHAGSWPQAAFKHIASLKSDLATALYDRVFIRGADTTAGHPMAALAEAISQVMAELPAIEDEVGEGLRVRQLRSLADATQWGQRVGNCLSSPLHVAAYLQRRNLLFAVSNGRRGRAGCATAAIEARASGGLAEFRLVEVRTSVGTVVPEAHWQLLRALANRLKTEIHVDGVSSFARSAEHLSRFSPKWGHATLGEEVNLEELRRYVEARFGVTSTLSAQSPQHCA